jgi:hypothetical protein
MQVQTGGRLLGQGVYGCTFEPAPRCAGGSVFKTIGGLPAVGKIVSDDAAEELKVGKAIMALPLATAYFALPSEECKPEMPVQDTEASSCRVTTEAGAFTQFSMLLMPSGGQPLLKFGANLERLATNYLRVFVHLLEGGIIYQNAGYVHNDIHMGNVLVDDKNVARYIDFGLAFQLKDVKVWEDANLGTRFKPKYMMQPPEIHCWRMMLGGLRLADGVKELKDMNSEYGRLEHQFPQRAQCLAAMMDLFKTHPAVRSKDGGAFVQEFGKRFDSWRLGFCMWLLWDDLLQWAPFMQSSVYGKRDLVRSVLGGLTDFDPRQRMTFAAALTVLDPGNRLANDLT